MKQTWKPTVVGILSIVAGASGIIFGFVTGGFLSHLFFFFNPAVILGVIAIVGGIFAMKREVWGLGLAGEICALLIPFASALGIAAIVLIALSKQEFRQSCCAPSNINTTQS